MQTAVIVTSREYNFSTQGKHTTVHGNAKRHGTFRAMRRMGQIFYWQQGVDRLWAGRSFDFFISLDSRKSIEKLPETFPFELETVSVASGMLFVISPGHAQDVSGNKCQRSGTYSARPSCSSNDAKLN